MVCLLKILCFVLLMLAPVSMSSAQTSLKRSVDSAKAVMPIVLNKEVAWTDISDKDTICSLTFLLEGKAAENVELLRANGYNTATYAQLLLTNDSLRKHKDLIRVLVDEKRQLEVIMRGMNIDCDVIDTISLGQLRLLTSDNLARVKDSLLLCTRIDFVNINVENDRHKGQTFLSWTSLSDDAYIHEMQTSDAEFFSLLQKDSVFAQRMAISIVGEHNMQPIVKSLARLKKAFVWLVINNETGDEYRVVITADDLQRKTGTNQYR